MLISLYKSIIESSPIGYAYHKIVCDDNGKPIDYEFIEVNKAFEELTFLKREDIVGKKVSEAIPSLMYDAFDWISFYGKIAIEGKKEEFEQFTEALNRWYRVVVFSPEKYYFVTHFVDITKEKQQLEELNNFFEVNLDLLCIANNDGDFIKVNKAWENVLGYSKEELETKRYLDFVHPDDMAATLAAMDKLEKQEDIMNFVNRYKSKDGTYKYIEWKSKPHGKLVYAAARDISERKKMEEDLKNQKEQFELAVKGSNDGIWDWNILTNDLFLSQKLKEQLGYEDHELENKFSTFEKLLYFEDKERVMKFVDDYMQKRTPVYDTEFRLHHKNGTLRWIRSRGEVIRDENDMPYRMAGSHTDITDDKEIRLRMMEQKENFSNFFNTIDDIFVVAKQDGTILFVNHAFTNKLGFELSDVKNKHILEMHPKELRGEAEKIFSEMFLGERKFCPLPLMNKDGEKIPVETRVWFGKWDGNDCIYGISKDLSSQQAALERFSKVFDCNPSLMYVSKLPERTILEINDAFIRKLGFEKDEVIGKTIIDLCLFPEEEKRKDATHILEKDGFVRDIEILVQKKDGSFLNGLFSGEVIENQIEKILLTVITDISDLKVAEAEVRMSEQKFRLYTEKAPIGILVSDVNGICSDLNQAACELLGYTKEELLNQNLIAKFGNETIQSKNIDNFDIFEKGTFEEEFEIIRKNGKRAFVYLMAVPINQEQILSFCMDITTRKITELQLIKAKEQAETANIAKSRFLANMSHEIRTPMNGILGFLQLLKNTVLNMEQIEYVRAMENSTDTLLSIINDILDVSKIEAGKLELETIEFNLTEVLEGAVYSLSNRTVSKGLDLHLHIEKDVPQMVYGDPTKLKQVLINLIGNAIKFTDKGDVLIESKLLESGESSAKIRFLIKDTGIGMANETVEKLFRPFVQADSSSTRKYGGTGLGLAICKSYIEAMNGEMSIKSKLSEGSEFAFDLTFWKNPIDQKEVDENILKVEKQYEKTVHFGSNRILVVSGNIINGKIIKEYLENDRWEVVVSENAVDSLSKLINGEENKFCMVLIDFQIGQMGAVDLAAAIKEIPQAKNLPLILLSYLGVKVEKRDLYFSSNITKPLKKSELINTVNLISAGKNPMNYLDQSFQSLNQVKPINFVTQESIGERLPKILVVEDNEINCNFFSKLLQAQGYECDVVTDGEQALRVCKILEYDLIFMDCQMPIMDGYETSRRLRQLESEENHKWIVAMTAYAMPDDKEKCLDAGMDDYISKPIQVTEVSRVMKEVMRKINK